MRPERRHDALDRREEDAHLLKWGLSRMHLDTEPNSEGPSLTAPLLSIIMPVYNTGPARLEASVASVMAQTDDDWELIIVDDGSTSSDTRNTVSKLADEDERIHVLRTPNRGVSAARNLGTARTRGEYVMYLDADDRLAPEVVSSVRKVRDSTAAQVILGYLVYGGTQEPELPPQQRQLMSFRDGHVATLREGLLAARGPLAGLAQGSPWIKNGPVARAVKRSLAVTTPFPEGLAISEDTLWNMELFRRAQTVAVTPTVWYEYWPTFPSASRGFREDAGVQTLRFLDMLYSLQTQAPAAYPAGFVFQWVLNELNRAVRTNYAHKKKGRSFFSQIREARRLASHSLVKRGAPIEEVFRAPWKQKGKYLLLRTGAAVPFLAADQKLRTMSSDRDGGR